MTKAESAQRIKNECINQGLELETQIAYVIATAEWETNHTLLPVEEAYWMDQEYRDSLPYAPYYGRGLIQLTWDYNYKTFSDITGADLLNYPEMALEYEFALFIMVYGLKYGIFTGVPLEEYINKDETDYYNARRCVNGTDNAETIANIADNIDHLIY